MNQDKFNLPMTFAYFVVLFNYVMDYYVNNLDRIDALQVLDTHIELSIQNR